VSLTGSPPRVSVFTPSHSATYLDDCLDSLLRQSYRDWEWILLLNGGCRWRPAVTDPRIRLETADEITGVGALKRRACELAHGDLLVELDHDDVLASSALARVVDTFLANPDVGFVYSHFAQIQADGSRDDTLSDSSHGLTFQEVTVDDRPVLQVTSLPSSPHNVSYVWYAPNHLRAFRRSAYEAAGGYDPSRVVCDDQDLMCRLYRHGEFRLIDECLYLQRVHDGNTQRDPAMNARIQRETVELYDRYIEGNAYSWARRHGLLALDVGGASDPPPGYLLVKRAGAPGADIHGDLSKGLPLPDGSVGVIRAVDVLQRFYDKVALFNEVYRLLAPGGLFLTQTPSTDGRGAFQDPSHVSFYNENSFWYFTQRRYGQFVEGLRCQFQVSRMRTYFPTDWHRDNHISYVQANLVAPKGAGRQGGVLDW
jgi:glycosyltransferase involved in cell wall biosynthesis